VRIGKTKVYITKKTKITGALAVGKRATARTYLKGKRHYALSIIVKGKTGVTSPSTDEEEVKAKKNVAGVIRRIAPNHSWVLIGKTRVYITKKTKIAGTLAVGKRAVASTYRKGRRHYATSIIVKGAAKTSPDKKKQPKVTPTPQKRKVKATKPPKINPTQTPRPKKIAPTPTPTG